MIKKFRPPQKWTVTLKGRAKGQKRLHLRTGVLKWNNSALRFQHTRFEAKTAPTPKS